MIINNRDQQTHEQADGADDFLAKPIVFAQLRAKLNKWKSTEGSQVKPSG
jgi:CheY-like chemotaxis protein